MSTVMSFLLIFLPLIINIGCIVIKGGKIISLIATLCGYVPSLLLMLLNSGYGIGFGNPWVGVEWGFTAMYLLYTLVLLITHFFVPSSGIIKTISSVVLVLAVICMALAVSLQIVNTAEHKESRKTETADAENLPDEK